MEIIESIRTYIVQYPDLDAEGAVRVDFLSNEPVNYSIEPVPSTTIISEDIAGNTVRQYLFQFASQQAYGSDTLNNMANSGFFEKFAAWLETKTKDKQLPTMAAGQTPLKIYAEGVGFVDSTTEDSARYSIQCGLIYKQEG